MSVLIFINFSELTSLTGFNLFSDRTKTDNSEEYNGNATIVQNMTDPVWWDK